MLAKSLLAGCISAIMAGSVVYFGTSSTTNNDKPIEATSQAETVEVKVVEVIKTPEVNAKTSVETKAPHGSATKAPVDNSSKVANPAPKKKKWLDQYLKPAEQSEVKKAERVEHPHSKPEEKIEKPDLNKEKLDKKKAEKLKLKKEKLEQKKAEKTKLRKEKLAKLKAENQKLKEELLEKEKEGETETVSRKYQDLETSAGSGTVAGEMAKPENEATAEKVMTDDGSAAEAVEAPNTQPATEDLPAMEDLKVEIFPEAPAWVVVPETEELPKNQFSEALVTPHGGVYDIAFREIEAISAEELKNQAYFILVNRALEDCAYDIAKEAIANISAVEMKETARINLAVAYGREGNHEAAFELINEVEQGEYRDILRLQVIEALLQTPENSKEHSHQ